MPLPFQFTPASMHYRMPAEWEPHEATWLAWPHNEETWPGERLQKVEEIYLQMIEALLPGEQVKLLVGDARMERHVVSLCKKREIDTENLMFFKRETVDAWVRDYGPTFLKHEKGDKAWCKWFFNAWGNKYPDLAKDAHVFDNAREAISSPCFEVPIYLEGGSIETNGAGTLLVTEQCLLNPNRNPKYSQADIEKWLRDSLGVEQILWMKDGILGDDTDGHIDDIIRFVDQNTILCAYEENEKDLNHTILKDNWDLLEKSTQLDGKPWKLKKLPMPTPIEVEGERLPASYANFYIANEVVLLPIYDCENDEAAIDILKESFPNRRIVAIGCEDLVYGLGSIHCVTQQEPL